MAWAPPWMEEAMMWGKGGGKGPLAEGTPMMGDVKRLDEAKGFGFITVAGFPRDIYFKLEETVQVGQGVSFTLMWTRDGKPQARDIAIAPQEGETLVGTLKSYNEKKGYGFITAENSPQDIYFKTENMNEVMQALDVQDLPGCQVRFVLHIRPDGKPTCQDMVVVGAAPQGAKRTAASMAEMGGAITPSAKRPRIAQKAQVADSSAKLQGVIKSYRVEKGFGFIGCADVPVDVYFKNIMLPEHLREAGDALTGQPVQFELTYTMDGKPQAREIELHAS